LVSATTGGSSFAGWSLFPFAGDTSFLEADTLFLEFKTSFLAGETVFLPFV